METSTTRILVKRYTPPQPSPYYQTYELRFHDDMTVLDALSNIKDTLDGSLSFRWSCRMGICGSCAMIINGKPVLTCQTYMRNVVKENTPLTVEPLRNFPIIKDLIVDISDVFEKMRSTMPYVERMEKRAVAEGSFSQSPKERKKIEQASQCIKCMICYSACPVYGLDKNFMGPAAGTLALRYTVDSHEGKEHKEKRMDVVTGEKGVWKCSFVGECSSACPKRVDPAQALQRLKLMGALHVGKSELMGIKSRVKSKKTSS